MDRVNMKTIGIVDASLWMDVDCGCEVWSTSTCVCT